MGNRIPNATIAIKAGANSSLARLSYHDLADHILLLRRVIAHPELTQEGPILNYFIREYYLRMAGRKMRTAFQQTMLPWQIDWIWHVHRLHPLAYYHDCMHSFAGGELVDKHYLSLKAVEELPPAPMVFANEHLTAPLTVGSMDLAKAVVRQRRFLDKFQQHFLYSWNLADLDYAAFRKMVQDYVLFLKLARAKEMIVPTFDIDLLWHTHMRYPSQYRDCSIAFCGFVLNHDDSIDEKTLKQAAEKTNERWKKSYRSDTSAANDFILLDASSHGSSCATMVREKRLGWFDDGSDDGDSDSSCSSSCGGCGGD